MANLREMLMRIREDLDTVIAEDPSVHSRAEALLHPHITALWLYRVAHWHYRNDRRIFARALGLAARFATGIEIHPGARIGRRFFIDHGAAVVIGETVVIGDNVMFYHQVTLGSLGWWKDNQQPGERRHPIIEDDVIVGTNASILGAITVGQGSRIGAHSVLTRSVPEYSRVSVAPATVASLDIVADASITGEQTPFASGKAPGPGLAQDSGGPVINGSRKD